MAIKALPNENELLGRVSIGDEKAFEIIFLGYYNPLGEYVLMLTKSPEITEEIIQDVFLKIWQNRSVLVGIEKFSAYLFILTKNYTLNALRKLVNDERRQQEWGMDKSRDEVFPDFAQEHQSESNYEVVLRQAVESLPPQQKTVFNLRMQGHKNHEIAIRMDISADSVKKYQQYAVSRIKKYIKSNDCVDIFYILLLFNDIIDKK
jgi:RNA polymerase sigma-70 factor (ECF subfamily)